jgi:regulator of cell morphogenesis and NO signaling
MQITASTKVGDIAAHIPASLSVFERYGVDFCCGGQKPLQEALAEKGLSVGDLIVEIEQAQQAQKDEDELHEDWSLMSPGGLVDHIEHAHHSFLREQLPRAGAELATVIGVHGENHPELWEIGRIYDGMRKELEEHLLKEEQHLFPAIRELEKLRDSNGSEIRDSEQAQTLASGLKELEDEHDAVGEALHKIHDLTFNYQAPPDACMTFSGVYRRLMELEADVHRHVHLENNILIPAVRELIAT